MCSEGKEESSVCDRRYVHEGITASEPPYLNYLMTYRDLIWHGANEAAGRGNDSIVLPSPPGLAA